MSEKRELVFKAFNNEKTDRVPVGFWFHYTPNELLSAYEHPEYRDLNINGHKNFVKSFKPDFVKLMSDGYFFEPETAKIIGKAKKAADLRKLVPIAANDKWIKDQVSLVKKLTTSFGKEVAKNNLSLFKNYPAKVINFASVVEGISLKKGKALFGGKAVIGGFENTKKDLLYKGTKEEIQAETKRLLKEAGKTGIILGADCTVPKDINFERFEWVREAAK